MITADNVKLFKAENQTDDDAGGGLMSADEVVDGKINNLYPNISRMDRLNGRIQLRKVFNKIVSDDRNDFPATVAAAVSVNDLSSGHDWSTTNETFDINVNGGGRVTVTLDATCANLAAVIAEINTAFTEQSITGVEAYDPDVSNCVGIRTTGTGADKSFILYAAEENNALATLGLSAGTYQGTDEDRSPASYIGAHNIIADQPADPNVRMFLFEPTAYADQRAAIQAYIESYFEKSTLAWHPSCVLTYDAQAGTRQLVTIIRNYQYQPYWHEYNGGTNYFEQRSDTKFFVDVYADDIIYIEYDDGAEVYGEFAQVVKRQVLRQELDNADENHYYIVDYCILHLASDLVNMYPKVSSSVDIYHTAKNPAWKAYGTVETSGAVSEGDSDIPVAGLTDKLAPTVDIVADIENEAYFQPAGFENQVAASFEDGVNNAEYKTYVDQVRQPEVSESFEVEEFSGAFVRQLQGEPIPESLTISWYAEDEWNTVRSDSNGVLSGDYGGGTLTADTKLISASFTRYPEIGTHVIVKYIRANNFNKRENVEVSTSGWQDTEEIQESDVAGSGNYEENVSMPSEKAGVGRTVSVAETAAGEVLLSLGIDYFLTPRSVKIYKSNGSDWDLIASDTGVSPVFGLTGIISDETAFSFTSAGFGGGCVYNKTVGARIRLTGDFSSGDELRFYFCKFETVSLLDITSGDNVSIPPASGGSTTIYVTNALSGTIYLTIKSWDVVSQEYISGVMGPEDPVTGIFQPITVAGELFSAQVVNNYGLFDGTGITKIQVTRNGDRSFRYAEIKEGLGMNFPQYLCDLTDPKVSTLTRTVSSGSLVLGTVEVLIDDVVGFSSSESGNALSGPQGTGFYDAETARVVLYFDTPKTVAFNLKVNFDYMGDAVFYKTAVLIQSAYTGIYPASLFLEVYMKLNGGIGASERVILVTDNEGNLTLPKTVFPWVAPAAVMHNDDLDTVMNFAQLQHINGESWLFSCHEYKSYGFSACFVYISYNAGMTWSVLFKSDTGISGNNAMCVGVKVETDGTYLFMRFSKESNYTTCFTSATGSGWIQRGNWEASTDRTNIGQVVYSGGYWFAREESCSTPDDVSDPKVIKYSDDDGDTWASCTALPEDSSFLLLHDRGEGLRVYAFCDSGNGYYSDDLGSTWVAFVTQISGARIWDAVILEETNGNIVIAAVNEDGLVSLCRNTDGLTFKACTMPATSGKHYSIGINDSGVIVLASHTFYVSVSDDWGQTWRTELQRDRYNAYTGNTTSNAYGNYMRYASGSWVNGLWYHLDEDTVDRGIGISATPVRVYDALGNAVTDFGTVNFGAGVVSYDGPRMELPQFRFFLTEWECTSLAICTHGARPFIDGSFSITVTKKNGGIISAVESAGLLSGDDDVSGTVDKVKGYAVINFDVGINTQSFRLSYSYKTVFRPTYDELNTRALPLDGRVPVIRSGDVIILKDHHAQSELADGIDNSELSITVRDASRFPTNERVIQVDNEKILVDSRDGNTFTVNAAGRGYDGTAPASHDAGATVKLMTINTDMLTVVTATASELRLANSVAHDYMSGSLVASVYLLGDLQTRMSANHTQGTWDGITWDDEDEWAGEAADGSYNFTDHPMELTNAGASTERWAIEVKQIPVDWNANPEDFKVDVVGENRGLVLSDFSALISDIEPMNYNTMYTYFCLSKDGWDHNWEVGEILRFNIIGADPPVWGCRAIDAGAIFAEDDRAVIAVRGDVADIVGDE